MTSVSINNTKIKRAVKNSWLDKLAKKIVFSAFSNLRFGRLVVDDNDQIQAFGDQNPNCELVGHIHVHHPSVYRDFLMNGSIGCGEAYMRGTWSSPNLLNVVRLFCKNIDSLNRFDNSRPLIGRLPSKFFHLFNANTLTGSRKNISAHYDLGNNFFKLFLDSRMMYSAAIYPSADTKLEEAAVYKLDVLCKKLRLNEDDHLLEIGTGWGGLAIHAARHYGCKVTTTTISQEQYNHAKESVIEAGLENKVKVLLQDYRELQGTYSKLVSVEMIEAVGHQHYKEYFSTCSKLLEADGLMCIQAITIPDQRYDQAIKSVDFIQRYIFPGGCLPSNEVISRCVARYTDMQIVGLEDIGMDYARTLADWRKGFEANLERVKTLGFDDVFCRMWEFYLCYCEGGFRERAISTVHVVMAKPDARKIEPLT
jgi:cyclopropane-fatty-acyl-phospholipid synthase